MSNARERHLPAHAPWSRMSAGVDWFIPAHVRDGDLDEFSRARLVVVSSWTLIVLAINYAAIFFSMNSPISAAALGLAIGVALASLYVLRRTGSCFAAGNLLTAALFGVLTFLACRLGGQGSVPLPWYASVPVVSLSTAGRRSAVSWLAVTASSLAAFYALEYRGYSFPNELTPHHYALLGLLAWIGLIVLMLALALLYEMAKEQMRCGLAQNNRFLHTVVESVAHPFLVIDANDYSIRLANAAARRNGAPGAKTCHALTHHRDTPCADADCTCPLVEVRRTGRPNMVEHTHHGAGGSPRMFEVHAHPVFDDNGRVVQVIEYSLDITEYKRHAEMLERAQKMAEGHAKRATRAVDDMERMNAAMMSREGRVLEMKQEVNGLLAQLGRQRKYEHAWPPAKAD